ncbi:hypothetical protein BH09ACT4_BH09ACT4_12530 [soil metagenome]
MSSSALTPGQELAVEQIRELCSVSDGAIEVLDVRQVGTTTAITISMDTAGIRHESGGIRVRARERFQLDVGTDYPFKPPGVCVAHSRWAGTPHVQWKRHLCIYAAPSIEWNPGEGFRGLLLRLSTWLQRAAEGALDPDTQPLHPPVAYALPGAARIVVHADLGGSLDWSTGRTNVPEVWAWCTRDEERLDLDAWTTLLDVYDRVLSPGFTGLDDRGRPLVLVPCLALEQEIGFEYPTRAADLRDSLEAAGVPQEQLIRTLTRAAIVNRVLSSLQSAATPAVMMLATPSRRVEGHGEKLAHLSSWKLDEHGAKVADLLARVEHGPASELKPEIVVLAKAWLDASQLQWMNVLEDRPEVTNRRDSATAAAWLRGKSVLVLGCGALGGPIAEFIVRAGASGVTVVDNGTVGPGILVRQPYYDRDIGSAKAAALALRLGTIDPRISVVGTVENVVAFVRDPAFEPDRYQLIIDATADVGARTAIEVARKNNRQTWPPLLTAVIGHAASRGLVALSQQGASGGGLDVLRRVRLRAQLTEEQAWSDIVADFFPATPRTEHFFPEPGCSAPTFIGSASAVTALAATLFDAGLTMITSDDSPMQASAVRLLGSGTRLQTDVWSWPNDLLIEEESGFEVRLSQAALSEMRAEARRGVRVRSETIETGGMLIGHLDEATRVVHIDAAAGPPPDSTLSSLFFDHGIEGTQEVLDHYRRHTNNGVGFLGMWHTHPLGRASPSLTDEFGMATILAFEGAGRRALMLILGGPHARWSRWITGGEPPHVYARLVDRTKLIPMPAAGVRVEQPDGKWYPGGYGYQPPATPATARHD